jgi:predicted ATPase/DNA-binding CsgD family transcriptional regulator
LTAFVGREDEVRTLSSQVREHRLMTLLGVGGVGKTRLSYQVLEELAPTYGDRIWAVELAPLADPGLFGHTVAAALGLSTEAEAFDPAVLASHIGAEPALVYLDNCEHLVEAAAAFVSAVLPQCPLLHVIASSRQLLGVPGERSYPVPQLRAEDGVALFADRARAVLPAWSLSGDNEAAVAELCAELEGLPLAIELAAVQIRLFTPAAIVQRLRDQRGPVSARHGGEARARSMQASIQWSHDLCTEGERMLWRRLSVYAGGFALEAVEQACTDGRLDQHAVLEALAGLVDKSLVVREAEETTSRYRMLEVIRQFGMARLGEAGELQVWRRRHRDFYVDLAERFDREWFGPTQPEWIQLLEREQANFRLAFDFSVADPGEAPYAMRMCIVLEHFFASHGGGGAAVRWLDLALSHGTGTPMQRAGALRVGVFVASLVADLDTAGRFYDELATIVEGIDDTTSRGYLCYAGAMLRTWQGDAVTGAALAAEGAELLRHVGDTEKQVNLYFLRGMMLGWADLPDDAAVAYRQCLEVCRPAGELWLSSYAQWGLGLDALLSGRVTEAIEREREALRHKARFHDQLGIGLALEPLAWAAAERRHGQQAALLLGAAESIWAVIGMSIAAMPYISRRRELGIERTRSLLTPREYDDLVQRGRQLPLDQVIALALGQDAGNDPDRWLTRREREIADLVVSGASNKSIAEQLVISVRTVESHVENVMRKLDVSARRDVAKALDRLRR